MYTYMCVCACVAVCIKYTEDVLACACMSPFLGSPDFHSVNKLGRPQSLSCHVG